jgi:transcriptional pleiotropic regulator of transition state genes
MLTPVGQIREIDKLGRLVIPVDLRHLMDVKPGDKMEFFYDGEMKAVYLRKYACEMKNGGK